MNRGPCKHCITYAICYSRYKNGCASYDKSVSVRCLMARCKYLDDYMNEQLKDRLKHENVIITGCMGIRDMTYLETPFELGVRIGFCFREY